MVQKYKTPFTKTLFDRTIDDIVVPPDFEEYMILGANVARYQFSEGGYDHIFRDFVDEHTKRMVLYAEQLPLPEGQKNALIRTLWIHDIPEIIDSQTSLSDMTSTDKIRYPHLALQVKNREQAIADAVFTPEDRALYDAFDPAKDMLFKGHFDFETLTPVALLARVLDNFIDGTNSFHGFVAAYLSSPAYTPLLPLPNRDSFEYCFHRGTDVQGHISALSHPEYEEVKGIILDILRDDFFGYVEELWNPIALMRLPDYAREEYQSYQHKLKNTHLTI